jgi:hypothetical protein
MKQLLISKDDLGFQRHDCLNHNILTYFFFKSIKNTENSSYRNAYPIQSEVVKSKKHCLLYPNPLSRGLLGSI